jgi:uncharacterized membrane protein
MKISPEVSEWLNLLVRWFHVFAAILWVGSTYYFTWLDGRFQEEEREGEMSTWTAAAFGLGMLVVAWIVYDLLVQSPLGRDERAFAVVAYALVVGAAYLSTHVLSGRAAFIHVGAAFGTIMFLNVWMRILPSQKRMIAAVKEGREPDPAEGARAKLRSKHNTFMVVPLVFTMISNHYPTSTYGREYNWVILSALVLVGWVAAKLIRRA